MPLYQGAIEWNLSRGTPRALLVSVAITGGLSAPLQGVGDGGTFRTAHVVADEPEFRCVAASESSIAGPSLGGDTAMLWPLGSPNLPSRGFGEDDGGSYAVTTYHYGGLEVDTVRVRIDRIEAISPS